MVESYAWHPRAGLDCRPVPAGAILLKHLTDQGRQRIDEIAQRYSVSPDAVTMLDAHTIYDQGTTNHPNRRLVDLLGDYQRVWRASLTVRRRGRLQGPL
jgi:hypothetical protein